VYVEALLEKEAVLHIEGVVIEPLLVPYRAAAKE
jgi:hypothetical protein